MGKSRLNEMHSKGKERVEGENCLASGLLRISWMRIDAKRERAQSIGYVCQ